jgi:hypothetical protein
MYIVQTDEYCMYIWLCVTVYWLVTPIIHVYVINVGHTYTHSHVHTPQIYTVQRLLTYFANLELTLLVNFGSGSF